MTSRFEILLFSSAQLWLCCVLMGRNCVLASVIYDIIGIFPTCFQRFAVLSPFFIFPISLSFRYPVLSFFSFFSFDTTQQCVYFSLVGPLFQFSFSWLWVILDRLYIHLFSEVRCCWFMLLADAKIQTPSCILVFSSSLI